MLIELVLSLKEENIDARNIEDNFPKGKEKGNLPLPCIFHLYLQERRILSSMFVNNFPASLDATQCQSLSGEEQA